MNPVIIPVLYSVVIINIFLSSIIFSRGFKNDLNLLFGCMAMAVAVWSFAIIGFYTPIFKFQFNWIALTHSAALFSAMILLYFSFSFPNKIYSNKTLLFAPFIPMLIATYYLFFTNGILGPIIGTSYTINHGYIYYQFILILFFIGSYVALYLQYRKAQNSNVKQQVKFIFIGCLFASFFGTITDLILPAINIFQYTWLGPIFTLVLVGSIFIAILRYHLFNIKFILSEFLSIALIVALSVDVFLETNPTFVVIKTIVLLIVAVFAYFLIKSVYDEIKLREKIEELAKNLELANAQQESLIHFITHQIKGFFTKSRDIYSMALEGDFGELPETFRPIIQEGLESETKGVALVKEILDSANLKKGTLKYTMVPFDLKPIVLSIASDQKKIAEKKGLQMDVHVDDGDYAMVGDAEQMQHVIRNVIDNSIKYTLEGGLSISLSQDDKKILFTVKDTGVGITDEDRLQLFTAGGKGKNSIKINVESTGFGLFIVKEIIEKHSGKIWVESDGAGKGSTFFVELPKKQEVANEVVTQVVA